MITKAAIHSLMFFAFSLGMTGCLRDLRTGRLGLDDVNVAERGFSIDGLYQFDLVPKIRNTGVLRVEAKLAVGCKVAESEEKEGRSEAFFLNLDTGQSKNGRPVRFTSRTVNPGSRITYKCHLIPNDEVTKQMLSSQPFDADFEVTGASSSN